jgi:RimJ/RimL family protein N-acetyltransferase
MLVCETERLVIRHFELADAAFIVKQLNEESFIRFIGDKKIRDIADAEKYLKEGPILSYKNFGFGLNAVLLKQGKVLIGMCGLVKRNELEHPDLGYAFLPEFWGKGYATEASTAILDDAVLTHQLKTVLGVTLPDNRPSNGLLTRIGFIQNGSVDLYGSKNTLYEFQANH